MMKLTNKILVTATLDCGNDVTGYLSILSYDTENIKAGFYVSNKAGKPFAYKISPECIKNIGLINE